MRALLVFAAALIAAELLHRRDDELGTTDEEADRFSVTAPIAAAVAILLGPLQAFVLSVVCVTPVRRLQRAGWRESGVRAFALGAASLAAASRMSSRVPRAAQSRSPTTSSASPSSASRSPSSRRSSS